MHTEERLPSARRSALVWPLIALGLLLSLLSLIWLLLLYWNGSSRQATFEDYLDYPSTTAALRKTEDGQGTEFQDVSFQPASFGAPLPDGEPTPKGRPSPKPKPSPSVQPKPSPSPSPQPSPSPLASPSPDASQTPTPVPAGPDRYKITVHYPDRFRSGRDEETITLDLTKMPAQRANSENEARGALAFINAAYFINAASQPAQVTAEAPKVDSAGRLSETLAVVRLISDDLTVLSGPPATPQPLNKQWSWKVRPTRDWTKNASFTFEMDFVRRTEGAPDVTSKGVWKPANPFTFSVGGATSSYLWWLLPLVLLGLVLLLLGLWLWRRRPDLRIDHIIKSDPHDKRKRITHISGLNPGTDERWTISTERAVELIENGTYKFHTLADGYRANVIVGVSTSGNKYIQTVGDADGPNNLLSLPQLTE